MDVGERPAATALFSKSSRLLKRSDFRRVYDEGLRVNSASFSVVYRIRAGGSCPRAGFTTPRALGEAVVRNRIRRRMREAVRLELVNFQAPCDLVFHPRKSAIQVEFESLRREVVKVLAKCRPS